MDSNEIPLNRLFNDLAHLWPVMSPPQEYAEEASCWRQVLWERLGPGRHHVLELGVGGGHNLSHLGDTLDATAVDISPRMLKHSIALNPGVEHIVGDMRCVRVGRTFEAVMIHDAISCITTARDLASVFTTAAAHLESGGLLILAPEYFPEQLSLPRIDCRTNSVQGLALTYVEYTHDPDPSDTMLEVLITYFIHSDNKLRIEHDRLLVGLFSRSTWRRLMHDAGFEYAERSFHLSQANVDYTLLLGTMR
jgi:SAM-dependent methyltransferase